MSGSVAQPRAFRLIVDDSPTRFLGLAVSERNRRVARRCGAVDGIEAGLPTLTLPARVAITPALIRALPDPSGVTHVLCDATAVPIVWAAPGADSRATPRVVHAPDGAVLDVSTPATRHTSAWHLLRSSGKPSDGWLSRHVHRKISRVFSYLFLRLGLTANVATFATFLLGAAGAWLIAHTTQWTLIAGTLLYWGSSVADGIDGEMARLTLNESPFGEKLDTGVDQATHLLALAGVGIGWWRQGIGTPGLVLAAAVAIGVPVVLLWAMALVRRARRTDQFFVVTTPIEWAVVRSAQDTRALPLRIAAIVFLLFRREAFSCAAFLVALLTGQRVVYPIVIAISLAVICATFLLYRKALDSALAEVV